MNRCLFLLGLSLSMGLLSSAFPSKNIEAHCQVPCGIYDDHTRIHLLEEHITTIEKGMTEVSFLSSEDEKNYNQIVRWVNNKDTHANEFQKIVTEYFMTQRIKPVDKDDEAYEDYQKKVVLLHQMLVTAMKCKQTTDKAHVAALRDQVKAFDALYSKPKKM